MFKRQIASLAASAAILLIPVQASAQEMEVAVAAAEADPVGENPELDALCAAQLNPSENSGFTAIAVDIKEETRTTVTRGVSVLSGIGAMTVSNTYRDAHINGQSVNIHAYGDKIVTYAGTRTTTPVTTSVTKVLTGTCHVHKRTNGRDNDGLHPGFMIAPFGLSRDTVDASSEPVVTVADEIVDDMSKPFVDEAASQRNLEFVICISPTKNPGVWRGANGYVSQIGGRTCSTQWYKDLNGSTPSVSLPAA